ncbi:MAG TPA: MarR family winged helix-turn-helix transcriptional regulator [Hydrogenophaga sp.]|uniref:MarR family winged helix-turn-helix transcriptional regulator n=1 Tax=Hydrogenophaga sp. TaxID=1904254 RepID=UPI002CF305E4|nr:MarR family winged helix-turn-helix transcriptional regulator [Hydrogenophaga sp.]HMN94414.1 MarR family winged helix-turn-helix transcriptional regulator [Hydrogenophaga sp.]HMP11402.1 MarR family winged helix-turn-helix transcriptional regulator [Hydrogenophaga sp.]
MPSTATSRLSPSSRSTKPRTELAGTSGNAKVTAAPAGTCERVDTSYLETLLGYNARRTALAVISVFLQRMAPYGLRPVDFSVLSVIAHNPGVTSRQICAALDILPPNLVGMIKSLEKRGLIERRPHPTDRRAQGLHLTAHGQALQKDAEATASQLEADVADRLSASELQTLIRLLRKVYLS